jgi:hypothetical protein
VVTVAKRLLQLVLSTAETWHSQKQAAVIKDCSLQHTIHHQLCKIPLIIS